jgi:ribosome-binding ATPase YchF (GTP1/OBG family)
MKPNIIHSIVICLTAFALLFMVACSSQEESLPDNVTEAALYLNIATIGQTRASTAELPDNETFLQSWRELGLLTAKPVIYCANVDEAAVADGNDFVARVQQLAEERHSGFACICAKLEEELQGLSAEEQAEMLSSYGISESGLVRIIRTGYDTLGLCSYFTAGPDEVRAWTIHKGWKAPQAAGVIHTDFERGFIRAEVISYADYMSHESEAACRSDGVLRVEGKEYVVQDGDVMHFLFNV